MAKKRGKTAKKAISLTAHCAQCSICKSEHKDEVEAMYVAYRPLREIEEKTELSQSAIHRHIQAFPELKERRRQNTLGICDYLIEKGLEAVENGTLRITPALLAEGFKMGAKVRGQLIDRTMDVSAALEGASDEELKFFEVTGRMPEKGELEVH